MYGFRRSGVQLCDSEMRNPDTAGRRFCVHSIQEQLFDAILPGLLPLALTLGCYKFLQKGKSSVWVMLFIVIVGAVGGLIGLFTPW